MSSLSYGGIELAVPTAQVVSMVEGYISTKDIYEFQSIDWSGINKDNVPFSTNSKDMPINIGRLRWPRGASRWAEAHLLVSSSQLSQIRQLAYVEMTSGHYKALNLVMNDDVGSITASMFMLPPRPLFQSPTVLNDPLQDLYLLTLVDDRYYWWWKAAGITASGTWASLYSDIGAALGITIVADTVNAAYLAPTADLGTRYRYLPLLLDAVAASTGQRIVRTLSGLVYAQNYDTAKAAVSQNLNSYFPRYAGGEFAFLPQAANDLNALAPVSVTVVFPRSDSGTPTPDQTYAYTITLASLALPEYTGIIGFPGTKAIIGNTFADFSGGGTPTNDAQLLALATQAAKDWYLWRVAKVDQKFAAIRNWLPEGLHDFVEWIFLMGGESTTRVQRPEWNDNSEDIHNEGTFGSDPGTFNLIVREVDLTPTVTNVTILEFDQADGFVVSQPSAGRARIDLTLTSTFNLTVEELDGAPSLTGINKIQFNQADGFVVSANGANTALIDLNFLQLTYILNTYYITSSQISTYDLFVTNINGIPIHASCLPKCPCRIYTTPYIVPAYTRVGNVITADANGVLLDLVVNPPNRVGDRILFDTGDSDGGIWVIASLGATASVVVDATVDVYATGLGAAVTYDSNSEQVIANANGPIGAIDGQTLVVGSIILYNPGVSIATGVYLVTDLGAVAATGNITAASNTNPIVITSIAHGLSDNDKVIVSGVTVNTNANGVWFITVVDADHFGLNGSVGNGGPIVGLGAWARLGRPFRLQRDLANPPMVFNARIKISTGTVHANEVYKVTTANPIYINFGLVDNDPEFPKLNTPITIVIDTTPPTARPWVWVRAADFDESSDIQDGILVSVGGESIQMPESLWMLVSFDPIVLNTDDILFCLLAQCDQGSGAFPGTDYQILFHQNSEPKKAKFKWVSDLTEKLVPTPNDFLLISDMADATVGQHKKVKYGSTYSLGRGFSHFFTDFGANWQQSYLGGPDIGWWDLNGGENPHAPGEPHHYGIAMHTSAPSITAQGCGWTTAVDCILLDTDTYIYESCMKMGEFVSDITFITAATNANPIVITYAYGPTPALVTGDTVKVYSCVGNTAANGTRTVTVINATSFSLDGSTGNGAYTGGGHFGVSKTGGNVGYMVQYGFADGFDSWVIDGNLLAFRYTNDLNGGKWQLIARTTVVGVTTETTADSGVAVAAGTWYVLRIVYDGSGPTATFYIDGTSVGTITTHIPTAEYIGYQGGWKKFAPQDESSTRFVKTDYVEFTAFLAR